MRKLIIILILCLCVPSFGQFNDSEPMFGEQLNLGHWSTDGLVGYWRFIEAGNLVDESLVGNHGTITDATWSGGGLNFIASDKTNLVSIPIDTTLFGSEATVVMWLKVDIDPPIVDDWSGIGKIDNVASANHYPFTDNNIYLGWLRNDRITVGNVGVNKGVPHQLVVSNKPGANNWKFYQNGVEYFNTTGESVVSIVSPINIGGQVAGDKWLDGQIFYIAIYNRALSASEIQQLYINPNLPMQQEPIWLFFSPDVGSLQWIIDGGHIGPSPLKGSVVR